MQQLLYNGELHSDSILLSPACNGFRYGQGLFETIRFSKGSLHLPQQHYQRLMSGLEFLFLKPPKHWSFEFFQSQVNDVAALVAAPDLRVRLTVFSASTSFASDGNEEFHWILQATELPGDYLHFNENGYRLCTFQNAFKATGQLSNLKNNNYLLSLLAAKHSHREQCSDAILMNSFGRVVETSVANIFTVSKNIITTPSLSEGPVAGIMREHIIKIARQLGYLIRESELSTDDLLNAEEVFLTNALYGIRWVSEYGTKKYGNKIASSLYQHLY